MGSEELRHAKVHYRFLEKSLLIYLFAPLANIPLFLRFSLSLPLVLSLLHTRSHFPSPYLAQFRSQHLPLSYITFQIVHFFTYLFIAWVSTQLHQTLHEVRDGSACA